MLFPLNEQLSRADFDAYVSKTFGALSDQITAAYADDLSVSPGLAQREIATDLFMAYGMRDWAGHMRRQDVPTYLYFMEHVPPAFQMYLADEPTLNLADGPRSAGAYHSGDLAYVFNNLERFAVNWTDEDRNYGRDERVLDRVRQNRQSKSFRFTRVATIRCTTTQTLRIGTPMEPILGARRHKLDLMQQRFAAQSE